MKQIKVNLDKISETDLQLARNPRVIALLDEIIKLSLDERERRLEILQQKIQEGQASLFEERIQTKLLKDRAAEWIWVIHKNFPTIEQALRKRQQAQKTTITTISPKTSASKTPVAPMADGTHSELLKFLETQKPSSPAASSSSRIIQTEPEQPSSSSRTKDLLVGILLLLCLIVSVGYVLYSSKDDSSSTIKTFNEQARQQSSETSLSEEVEREAQTQFDTAAQELRLGDFEQGKTQLFDLIDTFPTSLYAENAYILLADTYRLRMNNPDEALKYYQIFLEKYPESSQAGLTQLKTGFSYEDMGDFPNAQATYRLVLSRHGERSRVGQLARDRLLRLEKENS